MNVEDIIGIGGSLPVRDSLILVREGRVRWPLRELTMPECPFAGIGSIVRARSLPAGDLELPQSARRKDFLVCSLS